MATVLSPVRSRQPENGLETSFTGTARFTGARSPMSFPRRTSTRCSEKSGSALPRLLQKGVKGGVELLRLFDEGAVTGVFNDRALHGSTFLLVL